MWALWHAPSMTPSEFAFHCWGIGSLRSSWAVYCSHAIAHGRWRHEIGAFGTPSFNAALAVANLGTIFGVLPSYWLLHHSHHTRLGTLPLDEARQRARNGRQTDGDIGIASRLFAPPSRRYTVATDRHGAFASRQPELTFQATSALLHGVAPLVFVGFGASALRSELAVGGEPGDEAAGTPRAERAVTRSLAAQAAASLSGWLLVAAASCSLDSVAPLALYTASQLLWLSPLNLNFVWTCPHVCTPGTQQPTVSFYTPDGPLGACLDAYLGWENYHVEHHDFPEVPMYLLPRLRVLAPEYYDGLSTRPLLDANTWREALTGSFTYACQDATFGDAATDAAAPTPEEEQTLSRLRSDEGDYS